MALCKEIKEGPFTARYWKICKVDLDCYTGYVRVYLRGWVDQQSRDNLEPYVLEKGFTFSKEDYTFNDDLPLLPQLYGKIKERVYTIDGEVYADFTDANDC